MLLRDYVSILKTHYKIRIGQEKLCSVLYSFVTDNVDYRDDEIGPDNIDKSNISKTLNGKAPIHQAVRNHIFDKTVEDKMTDSFQTNIVPNLIKDSDDIFYLFLRQIELDNISPEHLASIRMLAKKETVASFLATVFIYTIRTNDSKRLGNEKEISQGTQHNSNLQIKGLVNGKVVECPVIRLFQKRIGYTVEEVIDSIIKRIESIIAIRVEPYVEGNNDRLSLFGVSIKIPRGESYRYEAYKKETIVDMCSNLDYKLPDDFFELGDLHYGLDMFVDTNGSFSHRIEGSYEAKRKLNYLDALYEKIVEAHNTIPFADDFSKVYFLELAVENMGTGYDEDVRIVLKFPPKTIVAEKYIMENCRSSVNYLVDEIPSVLHIERGEDYLSYDETSDGRPRIIRLVEFGNRPRVTSSDVKDLLVYYIVTSNEYDSVEIKFDSINQYTTVAFPNVILLTNDSFNQIEYTIKSRMSPELISGKLRLMKEKANQ